MTCKQVEKSLRMMQKEPSVASKCHKYLQNTLLMLAESLGENMYLTGYSPDTEESSLSSLHTICTANTKEKNSALEKKFDRGTASTFHMRTRVPIFQKILFL